MSGYIIDEKQYCERCFCVTYKGEDEDDKKVV